MYKTVNWKTGPARARYNLKLKNKKNKAASNKQQATNHKQQAPEASSNKHLTN